ELAAPAHGDRHDREAGLEREHEAPLLEGEERSVERGAGALGKDHDRDALEHLGARGAQAGDRLHVVAAVDDDVPAVLEGPAEEGHAGQLDLGHPAELEVLERLHHGQDVELAAVVGHEDVGQRRVERGEPGGPDAQAIDEQVETHPELADTIAGALVEDRERHHHGREDDRVDRDEDQLQGGGKDRGGRFTASGRAVARFPVATSEVWTDAGGQRQERTEWHNVVVWGKQAETCGQYLAKGGQVYVEGSIRTRQYDDKEGNRRYITEIVAQRVQFLGGGGRGAEAPRGVAAAEEPPVGAPAAAAD